MTRTILLDGDVVAFQQSVIAEKSIDWGDGIWTLHADENFARQRVTNYIEHLAEKLKADDVKVCLTDTVNWRKSVMPTYKANRDGVRRPMILGAMRAWMTETFDVWLRPTLEGDDVMGILATSDKIVRGEKVIVSIDKDMATIPGLVFNPSKDESPRLVTEAQADRYHLIQALTGDATDNYPGCPSVGPKRAEAILDNFTFNDGKSFDVEGAWVAVVAAYAKKGLGEGEALRNAQVARILRASDYDFKKKEPILWTPTA